MMVLNTRYGWYVSTDSFRDLPLARLCKDHEAHADKSALPDNLGDGALYERNQVFRNIRDAAVAEGCRYTTDDPYGYFAWPLVQLPALLASRLIPYRKTYSAVNVLAQAAARVFTTAHAATLELQPNVVMHESAHCIADSVWEKRNGSKSAGDVNLAALLRFTVAESFANTCELAAMAFCQTVEDRWFLSFNSYWSWQEEIANAWKKVAAELMPEAPARWVLSCFVSANLQKKRILPELAGLHGIQIQKCSSSTQAALRLLHAEAFNLNPVFRRDTFDMFFRSLGHDPQMLLTLRAEQAFKQNDVAAGVFDDLIGVLV